MGRAKIMIKQDGEFTTKEIVILDSMILDQLWTKWASKYINHRGKKGYREIPYSSMNRSLSMCKNFEDWLFDNGAIVRQERGERYLEFVDGGRASWFMLKYL